MATFPSSLPKPLYVSYNESAKDVTIRTQMGVGPDKVRRRFTAAVQNLQYTIICSFAELATLETFYDDDTKGGSLSFTYTHPRTSATVTARFTSPPSWRAATPTHFNVSIELEVLP